MPSLIKNGRIVDDAWRVLKLTEGEDAASVSLDEEKLLVPLSVWLARKDGLISSTRPVGVWLDSNEGPEPIADDLGHFAVIALNFPKFADGRSYSTARLLRERFGYTGELRAIGDVLQDQLFFMKRCGFDAYVVRADKNIEAALAGLSGFSETYQVAVDQPIPLFRRRSA